MYFWGEYALCVCVCAYGIDLANCPPSTDLIEFPKPHVLSLSLSHIVLFLSKKKKSIFMFLSTLFCVQPSGLNAVFFIKDPILSEGG